MDVPTIPTVNLSQLGPGGVSLSESSGGGGDISSMLASLNTAPTAPMYDVGSIPTTARLPQPNMKPMANENMQPMRNNRHSEQIAENHNKFAQMTNILNRYSNKKEQEKMDILTANVKDISLAQAKIAEAQAALKTNPQDAAAKEVLDSNTKFIEGKLSDDKVRTQLAKAFDISFVDPTQNDSAEVKAGQAGIKQANEAQAAGVHHDTPTEKKVGESLNQPQVDKKDQTGTQAKASYADQFIKAMPKTLEANPIYQQQLKQYETREKLINQYIIPKLVDQQTRIETRKLAEQGALQRAEYKELNSNIRKQADILGKAAIADANNKAAMERTKSINTNHMAVASMIRRSIEKLAKDPDVVKNKISMDKLKQQGITQIDKIISIETNDLKRLSDMAALEKDPKKKASIQALIEATNVAVQSNQTERLRIQTDNYGTQESPMLGYENGHPNTTAVGPSDDSSNDEDSIIDSYAGTEAGVINIQDE